MLEDVLPCKTTLTANANAVKAAFTSQSRSTWNPGAYTHKTPLTTTETQALFVVNFAKLHLTAIN